jgi:cob(I)alamin adenosyltransferase
MKSPKKKTMKIYTKTGDRGTTQVYTSEVLRLDKNDAILECYGSIDELNSHIGLLSALMSNIDADINDANSLSPTFMFDIQKLQQELPTQTKFILPGGSQLAAQAHICRTVARRAERTIVSVSQQRNVPAICIQYLNRLSDYFFVAARAFNCRAQIADIEV